MTYDKCINTLIGLQYQVSTTYWHYLTHVTGAIIRQLRVDIGIELIKLLINNFDTINLQRKKTKNRGEQYFSYS